MRTKNETQEPNQSVTESDNSNVLSADAILADADREELEQLRAERDARVVAEKVLAEAEKRNATSVTINLPPAGGKGIQVAGRMYYHGQTYVVSNDLKWTLEEQERRCWAHESSLHESENKGRKQRRAYVS